MRKAATTREWRNIASPLHGLAARCGAPLAPTCLALVVVVAERFGQAVEVLGARPSIGYLAPEVMDVACGAALTLVAVGAWRGRANRKVGLHIGGAV